MNQQSDGQQSYIAPTLEGALAQVRRELGPDAWVVSTRSILRGSPEEAQRCVEVCAVAAHGYATSPVDLAPQRAMTPSLLEQRLLRMMVPEAMVRQIVARAPKGREGRTAAGGDTLGVLGGALRELVDFAAPIAPGALRLHALVGPTGVGKTTTIAKLAARSALVEGWRTALVCIDRYRIGAAEQLERYAELIGIPLEFAHDAASLRAAVQRLGDRELIFLDTCGRSPREEGALAQMATVLQGAGERVEVHLCLACGGTPVEVESIVDRHRVLAPSRLISTKIDEAMYHGSILAAQQHSRLALSYLTTGQRVPEDIEVADASRLAALFCWEGIAVC